MKRTSSSMTTIHMATKSGAQAITSYDDFEFCVLGISPFEDEEEEEHEDGTIAAANIRPLPPDRRARPALVFFNAPWCGPCRLAVPVFRDVIRDCANQVDAYEVDVDDLPEVAEALGVVSIPTIQLYVSGSDQDEEESENDQDIFGMEDEAVAIETIVGCVSRNVLGDTVDKVLEDYYNFP